MKFKILERLFNLALRGLSMGSKFVLVIFLAKYLTVEDIGLYGLVVATVSFSIILLGGEFYTYSQRELLSENNARWCWILQHQSLATILLYFLILPLQLLVFYNGWLPFELISLYFLLLVSEHIAQEINRILITFQQQLVASFILFFRLGAWCWVVIGLFLLDKSSHNIQTVLFCWLVGSVVSVFVGSAFIIKQLPDVSLSSVDIGWIKKGYKVAFKFFCATLCFRAIMTVDRYFMEYVGGKELLAVYVVYVSIAMAINSVLVPVVFSFVYPKLVSNYKKHMFTEYKKNVEELAWSVVILGGGVALLIGLLSPYVFEWTDKKILLEHINTLWLLLVMSFLYSLSMVPHYILYAKDLDRKILLSHVIGLVVFFLGSAVAVFKNDPNFILYSLVVSMLSLLSIKSLFALRNS